MKNLDCLIAIAARASLFLGLGGVLAACSATHDESEDASEFPGSAVANLTSPVNGCVELTAVSSLRNVTRKFPVSANVFQQFTLGGLPLTDIRLSGRLFSDPSCQGEPLFVASEALVQLSLQSPTASTTLSFQGNGRLTVDGTVEGFTCHAQDLVNPSFEDAAFNPGLGQYLTAPSSDITGWSVTSGAIHYSDGFWSSQGTRALDLNGGSPGAVAQSFGTTPSKRYRVTFALSGNPDRTTTCCGGAANSPTVKTLRVTAAGTSQDEAFDVSGHDLASLGWEDRTFEFVANSATTSLSFESLTTSPYWGPLLDQIRLEACD